MTKKKQDKTAVNESILKKENQFAPAPTPKPQYRDENLEKKMVDLYGPDKGKEEAHKIQQEAEEHRKKFIEDQIEFREKALNKSKKETINFITATYAPNVEVLHNYNSSLITNEAVSQEEFNKHKKELDYENDSTANNMAYLFGGEKGEEDAMALLDAANNKPLAERKKFIEDAINKRAKDTDSSIQKGIRAVPDIINNKQAVESIRENLGLKFDRENKKIYQTRGPKPNSGRVLIIDPKMPTDNIANPKSHVCGLALYYSNLCGAEQHKFRSDWEKHTKTAEKNNPILSKLSSPHDSEGKVSFEKDQKYEAAAQPSDMAAPAASSSSSPTPNEQNKPSKS